MGRILNRKAQSGRDLIFIIVFLFVFAIGTLIFTYVSGVLTTQMKAVPAFNETPAASNVLTQADNVNNAWDWVFLTIMVGFVLGSIVLGFFLDVSSIFFPIFVLVMLVGVPVVVGIEAAWTRISQDATFSQISDEKFPITNHIINNFLLYYVIMAAISMIATYAKTQNEPIG